MNGSALAGGSFRSKTGKQAWVEGRFDRSREVAGIHVGQAGSMVSTEGVGVRVLLHEDGGWREELNVSGRNVGYPLDGTFANGLTVLRRRFARPRRVDAVRVELRGEAPLVLAGFGLLPERDTDGRSTH